MGRFHHVAPFQKRNASLACLWDSCDCQFVFRSFHFYFKSLKALNGKGVCSISVLMGSPNGCLMRNGYLMFDSYLYT